MLEAAGCGCTDLGCNDSFSVVFNKVSMAWEPGSYVVSVDADGTKNTCTVDIPLTADPACTSAAQMALNLLPISGSSSQSKGLESIIIFGTPKLVQVNVARDGVSLGTSVFLPSYSVNEPNGAICGPTCHNAAGDLPVN